MLKIVLVLIGYALLFCLVGEGDLQEQQDFDQTYCENVRNGIWGNYLDIDCNSKVAKL